MIRRCSTRAFAGLGMLGAACIAAGALVFSPAVAADGPRAAPAPFSHGLSYEVDQRAITDASPTELVDCPNGTAVAGGGTFIDTEDPAAAQITNSTPFPAGDPNQDPDQGWLSEGNPGPSLSSAPMFAYAICSNSPGKLRYVGDSILVSGTEATVADCPKGTALTGGGVLTDSDLGDMIVVASRPYLKTPESKRPRGWYAAAHNYDGSEHALVAYAICSKQKEKYSYKRKTVPIPDASPGSAHKVVDCPKGRVVSGGGAGIAGGAQAGDAWLTSSSPQPAAVLDQTPKKGWIAEAISFEADELQVWALCKK